MRTILPIICFALASCAHLETTATVNADGSKSETVKYATLMGSSVLNTAGGTQLTHNGVKNGGQFFQTLSAFFGSLFGASVNASNNALTKSQAAQQTAREANARTPTIVEPILTPAGPVFPQVIPPATAIVPKP